MNPSNTLKQQKGVIRIKIRVYRQKEYPVCPEGFNRQEALHICVDMPRNGRYLAIESQSDYWCRPFFGGDPRQIPRMTQALLLEKDGIYRYYLPLCGGLVKAALRDGAEGMEAVLILNIDTITALEYEPVLLFAQGPEPMPLIRACAQLASQALGKQVKLRSERKLAPVFDFLGWCSWDAMQIRVNLQGLLEKAAELRQKGVPVRFAIIDDMWTHVPGLNDVPKTVSFHEMVQICTPANGMTSRGILSGLRRKWLLRLRI